MRTDHSTEGLQVYVVGGAVRDALLNQAAGDRDWVVVGATPEQMTARGFVPVGGDFPVFLHPETKEEYALARTERKSGRGYKGFTFYTGTEVTLDEDLRRRDLTVNAIAQTSTGELIDPLHGVRDLQAKILRHVGPAFEEDPVRILRLARFLARFTDFAVAPETLTLCHRMIASGEVDALVPERVWQEVSRGLVSQQPSRMLALLSEVGALARVMPELCLTARVLAWLDLTAQQGVPLALRYAVLCLDSTALKELAQRLRVPAECADAARLLPLVLSETLTLSHSGEAAALRAESILSLFERCDALRKPERFLLLVETVVVIEPAVKRTQPLWRDWLALVLSLDVGAVARRAGAPADIKQRVREARLNALVPVACRQMLENK